MLQKEMGFSFAGQHCRDFGLIYVESKGHPLSPDITRNEYTIAGKSGTVLLPGDTLGTMEFSGVLYLVDEQKNQAEAQRRLRRIQSWLCSGREQLIFDYEPSRFYMAQVDKQTTWSLEQWFGGGVSITFTAQPYAYNVVKDTSTVLTTDSSMNISLEVDTLYPAPLEAMISNVGSSPITRVRLGSGEVDLQGLNLAGGQDLQISMEEPIDATLSTGESALPYATRFSPIRLSGGWQTVPVALTYGSGKQNAQITLSARGRW